ncbi:MAG: DUF2993 domain-containing protein, partial [Cyanobacteria bacterium P01_H01_bin.121]
QVEALESLDFELSGSDRQLLAGQIPKVRVAAEQVIYQGIPLTQIAIMGEAIAINLKQILRGKPLQLLEPITVQAAIRASETDLNTAFKAPLLATALKTWLNTGLQLVGRNFQLTETPRLHLGIQATALTITVEMQQDDGHWQTFAMQAQPVLVSPHTFIVQEPKWLQPPPWENLSLDSLAGLELDLGTDVALESFVTEAGWLEAKGQLKVRP